MCFLNNRLRNPGDHSEDQLSEGQCQPQNPQEGTRATQGQRSHPAHGKPTMMVSHEHNPIPMQDEQTQNYAALMSDVHKTFLRSGETLTTYFKDSMVVNYFF